MALEQNLLPLMANSLRCEILWASGRMLFPPHVNAWRSMPCMVLVENLRGDYRYVVEGQPERALKRDEILVLPAGTWHQMKSGRPSLLNGLHLQYTVLGGQDVFSYYRVPSVVGGAPARRLAAWMDRLAKAYLDKSARPLAGAARLQELAFQILTELLAQGRPDEQRLDSLAATQRLLPALQFIQERLGEDLTRDQIARSAYLSPPRFHVLFKHCMGMAPMKYVQHARLRRAQELLGDQMLPVAQIAARLRFYDQFHFSKAFKKAFGLSPREYRASRRHNRP